MDNHKMNFGLGGYGKSVKDAIEDFELSYSEAKEMFKEVPEIDFEYKYDAASFLQYYSSKLSLAGLETITGVNQGQLSHYMTGHRKPSEKTIRKIENSIHNFADNLKQVRLI